MKLTASQLAEIPYLDTEAVAGRSLLLMPLWDGERWNQWIEGPDGKMIRLQMVDAALSHYLAKKSARPDDLHIPFFDLAWQRANYPSVSRAVLGISHDFHMIATCAAKLRHYYETRDRIDNVLLRSFVQSELEYLITVSRSIYDLLQETIARLWNGHAKLNDESSERKRKRNPLPETFRRVVVANDSTRTSEAIAEKYALPRGVAEQYINYAPFFLTLRSARDAIVHGGKSVDMIFSTEKGFCVDPKIKPFSDFNWTEVHQYNENIVSLYPWVAHVAMHALGACTELLGTLAASIQLPREVAPGYRVFLRDPSNPALAELVEVSEGKRIWWSN